MLRHLTLIAAIALGLCVSQGAIADDDDDGDRRDRDHSRSIGSKYFVGLWGAIDSFDGSFQHLSITCSSSRNCDVRLNDAAFTLSCANQIGFARGKGRIRDSVLRVNLTLYCEGAPENEEPPMQFNRFVPDLRNGTLINKNSDPNVPNIFHRISR